MSSTTLPPRVSVPQLAALAAELVAAARAFSGTLAEDPALLAEGPDELLESLTVQLHEARDATEASATVVTGRLDRTIGSVRGRLIAGRYPSTAGFLMAEAGMSAVQARAAVALGRALQRDYAVVADAWLAGRVPGGAVKALTAGVDDVLKRSARRSTPVSRDQVLADLLPVAEAGDLSSLEARVLLTRLEVDPDGCDEEALFAFETQNLSIAEHGSLWRISGDLTPEVAVATLTVLETAAQQIVADQLGPLVYEGGCAAAVAPGSGCTCGELDRARRAAGLQHQQVLARALGEVMTDRLDAGGLGTHHGVARHITLVGEVSDAAGALVGRMSVPGRDDDALLPPATMSRLLCDADITRVLTSAVVDAAAGAGARDGRAVDEATYLRAVRARLSAKARSVLYVGRSQRTVPARLRRALAARDAHCVFPGCHASVRRCHAQHVEPWEDGGATDLPNLATLCVAHHHAVHEGGWTMALRTGCTGHEAGCWAFTPPPLRRRPLRP